MWWNKKLKSILWNYECSFWKNVTVDSLTWLRLKKLYAQTWAFIVRGLSHIRVGLRCACAQTSWSIICSNSWPPEEQEKKQFLNFNQQIYLYAAQRLVFSKLKQAYSDAQVICKYWRVDWGYLCPVVLYRQCVALWSSLPITPSFHSVWLIHTHTHHALHCVADTLPF